VHVATDHPQLFKLLFGHCGRPLRLLKIEALLKYLNQAVFHRGVIWQPHLVNNEHAKRNYNDFICIFFYLTPPPPALFLCAIDAELIFSVNTQPQNFILQKYA
jgi:hypothetical protein